MQKGEAAKLKLLLSGISARLTKNKDFFVQAVGVFTSGKKKFEAKLTRDGEDYRLRFQGAERTVNADGFCAFFCRTGREIR